MFNIEPNKYIFLLIGLDNAKPITKSLSKKTVSNNMHRSSSVSKLDQVY